MTTKHINYDLPKLTLCGLVYGVGAYLDDHPGGATILRQCTGSDATAAFEDVGHSDEARGTLEKFAIGLLTEDEETRSVTASIFRSKVLPQMSATSTRRGYLSLQIGQTSASMLLALACVLLATRLLWADQVNMNAISAAMTNLSGFWGGVTLSLTGSAVIFSNVVHQFSKTIVMTKGFRTYPPVMKVNKIILGPSRSAEVPHKQDEALDTSQFKPMRLVDRARITTNSYRLVLRPNQSEMLRIPSGQHVQLRMEDKDGTIMRSYTPTNTLPDGSLELAIKVYAQGRMGNCLLSLPLNSTVDVRGPLGSFKNYHRFLCDSLGVLAGGSGITPVFALIKDIVTDENDKTRITLLYSEAGHGSTMMFDELNILAQRFPEKLKVHYFWKSVPPTHQVGKQESTDLPESRGQSNGDWTSLCASPGRIALASMQRMLPAVSARSKYLVCGPEGFTDQMVRDLGIMGALKPPGAGHCTDKVFVF